jgi:hypothetical protein
MIVAIALAVLAAAPGDLAVRHVIPPGREALVSEMLGSDPALPGGCICREIAIREDRVVAAYECPGAAPASLALRQRETPGAAIRTRSFAIFPDPPQDFPRALLDALRARIEAGEEGWRWLDARTTTAEEAVDFRWLFDSLAALVAVLAIALHVFLDRRASAGAVLVARQPHPPASWRDALPVAVAFAVALGLLLTLLDAPPLHMDTARDLLIAHDLRDGRDVAPVVPTAMTQLRLVHGALWIRFLASASHFGASLPVIRSVVLALQAFSVALVFHAARRVAGDWAGAAAAGAQLALGLAVTEAPVLWNPSILPLPLAIVGVGSIALARNGGLASALWAAVALGAAAQIHVLAIVIAPVLIVVVTATARRALLGTLATAAALIAAWAAGNEVALARAFAAAAKWPALAAVPLAAIALGAAARPLAQRTTPARRVAAAALALAVLPTAATVLLAAKVGQPLFARYFVAVLAGVPLATACTFPLLVGTSRRRAAATLAVALAAAGIVVARFVPVRRHGGTPDWTLYDATALATALSADGWTYADLHRHLRSPDRPRELLAAMGPFLPVSAAGAAGRADDLLVVKVRAQDVLDPPPSWHVIPLTGSHAAVARPLRSSLSWDGFDLCLQPLDRRETERCERGSVVPPSEPSFSARSYPEVTIASELPRTGGMGRVRARWKVRAVLDADAPTRLIEGVMGRARWRLAVGDAQGADALTLGPGRVDAEAVFTCETPDPEVVAWIPAYVETFEGEERLRALVAPWRR